MDWLMIIITPPWSSAFSSSHFIEISKASQRISFFVFYLFQNSPCGVKAIDAACKMNIFFFLFTHIEPVFDMLFKTNSNRFSFILYNCHHKIQIH